MNMLLTIIQINQKVGKQQETTIMQTTQHIKMHKHLSPYLSFFI